MINTTCQHSEDIFTRSFIKSGRKVETSLIQEFKYPKFGPGQMWDEVARKILAMGGIINKNARVVKINRDTKGNVKSIEYVDLKNSTREVECDILISSMPLKDLAEGMDKVPKAIRAIASGLPYRDYMTLGVLVSKFHLKNETSLKTVGDIVPDCWIYVQDRRVRMGRIQIYNNWSPYLVKDPENTVWIGLEYFVNEGDELWKMDEKEFSKIAISEMKTVGLITDSKEVLDSHLERVKKAYPAYFGTYDKINELIKYLSTIDNLYCVGRNGQHRYNNMDHSMCTSFEAVRNIASGTMNKNNIWQVNTEQEYHESKQ